MTDDIGPPDAAPGAAAEEFDRLLVRYFSGQLNRDDRRWLDRWLSEGPDRMGELERLRYLWARSAVEPMDVQVEGALARFKARARRDETAVPSVKRVRLALVASGRRLPWLAMAAGLAMVVGAGVWWRQATSPPNMAANALASRLYATARGQRDTVRLPDGTDVILAPSSMLEVPAGFGAGTRDVRLTGLAFFAVAKDSSRPFRVHGGGGIVQVLGTKFTVHAGTGNETIEVVVSEGRVALRPVGTLDRAIPAGPVLTRGDFGHIAADGTVEIVHGVDLASRLGWVDGRLSFDRTPLPVVLRELETWFGVDFVIASRALRDARLTTKFDNDSLADMLRVLEAALGAKADVMGKTVTLRVVGRSQ